MKNFLNQFFPEKNENYTKAKTKLQKVKEKFDGFVIGFPDITPNEIMFIIEKWESLPKSVAKDVKIMALNFIDGYKTLLTSYNPNSYILPHKHYKEYEFGVVLKGELVDKFTGRIYRVGDKYQFEPNQAHYLSSNHHGCLVYSTLSINANPDSLPISGDVKKIISYL